MVKVNSEKPFSLKNVIEYFRIPSNTNFGRRFLEGFLSIIFSFCLSNLTGLKQNVFILAKITN